MCIYIYVNMYATLITKEDVINSVGSGWNEGRVGTERRKERHDFIYYSCMKLLAKLEGKYIYYMYIARNLRRKSNKNGCT